jgi:hypothetical protein
MPFKITVTKLGESTTDGGTDSVEMFSGVVDEIDMLAISNMVYRPKRKPRADIGRARKETAK